MKRTTANLLLGLLALWAAGCVRFQPQPLSSAGTAAAFDARTLNNPDLKKFLEETTLRQLGAWPLRTWDFPTLTWVAFYYHPSLAVARAQWGVARAGIKTARGRPNPTVAVATIYNFSHINAAPNLSPWLPGVTFDLPIETAGKRRYRVAQAGHLSDAARWNLVTTAWQVRSNLRASLLDLETATRREQLLATQQAVQAQIVQSLEQRQSAGALARSELTPPRILLDKTRADLADARRQRAAARVRVADALGLPVSALDGVELEFDFDPSSPRAAGLTQPEARRRALQGRTDVLAALDDYAATQSALQLEIARQYPDVHLGTGYEWDQGDSKWQLGLGADLPVLNRNQGPIAEAGARRTEAAERFAALQAQAIAGIDAAVSSYGVAKEQLAATGALLENERRQLLAAQTQLAAGAIDPLDVLNARLELGQGELTRADALAKTQQALGELEDAVQQPLDATFDPSRVIATGGDLPQPPPRAMGTARHRTTPARRLKQENHP